MTFYEAALRILESEGHPLHSSEITERSIQRSLLSHIGKTPEQTMLSRLAAMARRKTDRKVMVTAKDTFALVDWALAEDPEALAQTGVVEEHPEESLPPLRPLERHPEARAENVRAVGRLERKRRHDEEQRGRKRKFPPLPEVVFELLSDADEPLTADELLEQARGRELAGDEITSERILTSLLEDNQRRIDAGRRPQFSFSRQTGKVALERAGTPSEAPPLDLQAAFAEALGIPLEGGRVRLSGTAPLAEADAGLLEGAKEAVKDARHRMARRMRRHLSLLDVGTLEKSMVKLLHALSFRELKVAKRSKEGPLLTARKREGSVELRYAIRILKGNPRIDRRMVQELRKDLGHYAAQVGLLLSGGEVRGDARSEAQGSGALVMLWCGDALAEKLFEQRVGVHVAQVELFELDESFFEAARLDAEEARTRRAERQRERERERPAPDGNAESAEAPRHAEARGFSEVAATAEPAESDADLDAARAFVGQEGAPEAPSGERKKRRRRRRGRRGRSGRDETEAQASNPEGGAEAEAGAPTDADAPAGVEVEAGSESSTTTEAPEQSASQAPSESGAEPPSPEGMEAPAEAGASVAVEDGVNETEPETKRSAPVLPAPEVSEAKPEAESPSEPPRDSAEGA